MTDEAQSTEDAVAVADEESGVPAEVDPPAADSDGNVEANWSVAVVPGEGASIHYRVTPSAETSSIRSVTASFVWAHHGIVKHSFAGSTYNDTMEPRAGQGTVGDMGADLTVFSNPPDDEGQVEAILAGMVNTEDGPQNFMFSKSVPLPESEDEEG